MIYIYKKTSFTLIELLAVIVISIILLGIAVPAFNTLTKGEKVETAARTIGSQLKAVRAYAITNREYAALIIPTTENLSSEYLYRSYRPCIVDSNYVFQEWVSAEKWMFMPSGTAVLDVDGTLGHPDTGAGSFESAGTVTTVDFSDISGGSSVSSKGIIFSPTGKTVNPATRKYVTVGDALLLESGVNATENTIEITIDLYSGRISYGSN
jgi:type II secretory pathway pseudopilin PulG